MKSTIQILPFFLLLTLLFPQCQEESGSQLSGQVIDAYTSTPLMDVQIILLENNAITTTNEKGNFGFSEMDLAALPNKVVGLQLSMEGYRPLEINATIDENNAIKLSPADIPVYYYHQPVQLSDGIPTGTIQDINMDQQLIQNMMDNLVRDKYKEIHSLLVYKDDMLVLEEYYYGNNDTIDFEHGVVVDRQPAPIQWSREDKHYVASANKALTGTIAGMVLAQEGISSDEAISQYLPDYASYFTDPNKAQVTLHHCLNMTAGFQWDEWSGNDLKDLWKSQDFAGFVLSRNNMSPDSEWRYNSALPNLTLRALSNILDQDIRDWADENFYQALGITDYKWQSQPDGIPEGSARMYLRPRDMLKIGITLLNDGQWSGQQIIPQAWVAKCMEVQENTDSGDYSHGFWLRELDGIKYLSAEGDGGNFINVFPEQNMVIVMTQGNYLKWPIYVDQMDDMMKNYIFPAVF
ncbi:serine hydrolase [Reichenbachiella agarivorans]|uniref:Serine hydrolase n=1 Tax=Reichenbachiella agarivorans TaxID=2979464 RepID=A0ABY6CQD7_9BACT|nr:serine hydrolase [Reichenbachiella agarivorans]UXP32733.1 serine hydrolase [Reichenbachiella agarivorans]